MHRLDRIGEHHIADLSADDHVLLQTPTNFTTSLGTLTLPQVQTDTAVVSDKVSTVNFNSGDAQKTWPLTALLSWSFGRFISGSPINDREVMIGYSLKAVVRAAAVNRAITLKLFAGMANADSVTVDITAQTNLMDTMCLLGVQNNVDNVDMSVINIKGTFLNTLFNGGASGDYDTNPLGIWLQVSNLQSSTTINIHSIIGSLSIYRYSQDIDTFDPTR